MVDKPSKLILFLNFESYDQGLDDQISPMKRQIRLHHPKILMSGQPLVLRYKYHDF